MLKVRSGVRRFALSAFCAAITFALFSGTREASASVNPVDPLSEFARSQNYTPTIVHSLDEVQALFDAERPLNHKSQCHERAEVWAHDLTTQMMGHPQLMKVMMFYTPRFRTTFEHSGVFNDSPYKWWYHTAPVIYADIGNGQGPVGYVLDSEFVKRPMTLDEWSYYFLHDEIVPNDINIPYVDKNKLGRPLTAQETHCQVISNFRQYAVPALTGDMNTAWCQMRLYPMYYMQPGDVANMDCDPAMDPDYTLGLTGYGTFHGAIGSAVLAKFTSGPMAGKYKYTCPKGDPMVLRDFRKSDLDTAYKNAHQR